MEKGYFHFNLGEANFNDDFGQPLSEDQIQQLVEKIPLPNQIPQKKDFSHLPKEILRSSTVETLIQQNDDLMSRLAVTLRRVARLEAETQDFEQKQNEFNQTIESLRDQLLIFRQKESLIEDRSEHWQAEINSLKEQIEFHEYALDEKDKLHDQLQVDHAKLLAGYQRLREYRRRLRELLPKFKNRFRKDLGMLAAEKEVLQVELAREIESRKLTQMRMEDLLNHFKSSQSASESTIKELRESLTKMSQEHLEALKDSQRKRELEELLIDRENKILTQERTFVSQQDEYRQEISQLQNQLALFRQDGHNKIIEIENQARELKSRKDELEQSKTALARSVEQAEALQSLWGDSQGKIEKLEAQIVSLQKLNQHLSIELHQKRSRKIQQEDQEILTTLVSKDIQDKNESPQDQNSDNRQVFAKIDGLINELQSGYSKRT